MKKLTRPSVVADPQLQLALEQLSELKSMDNEIWPSRKPPATNEAALTVAKGIHLVDAGRRKA